MKTEMLQEPASPEPASPEPASPEPASPEPASPEPAHNPAPPTGTTKCSPNAASPPCRSFSSTLFCCHYCETEAPEFPHSLLHAVSELILKYAKLRGISVQCAKNMFRSLQTRAFEHKEELLDEIQSSAARIWTAPEQLDGTEFCGILNVALREDNADLMPHAAVVVRALSLLVVTRFAQAPPSPPNNMVFRGGGLPLAHQPFFESLLSKKYRAPMFLAASFRRVVAQERFCRRAQLAGHPPVLWIIRLPPLFRCMHVNYLKKTECPGEDEYLFAPWSVMEVLEVVWVQSPTWENPHLVTLQAAADNLNEPDLLPVAPWA